MVYAFFEWLLSRGVNPKLNGVSEWGTRRDEDACAHRLCGSVWSHQSKKAHWIRTHRVFPASPINSILALRAKIYYFVKMFLALWTYVHVAKVIIADDIKVA